MEGLRIRHFLVNKDECNHDTYRTAQTEVVNGSALRRLEWCDHCGELLRDDEIKIPPPKDE